MWYDNIITCERQAHLVFFGKEFDLSQFQGDLGKFGEETVTTWQKMLLEPHFLPMVEMKRKAKFPGWKVRPTDHHYEAVYQGRVRRNFDNEFKVDKQAHLLFGGSVLIDTRLKPAYDNGKQMYADDYLGPILSKLRHDKKIPQYQYGEQGSRFGVSADEWEEHVKFALTKDKRFRSVKRWRLERSIEANIIPQIYLHMPRKDNGFTNTWQWYEEYFGDDSYRVYGGYSACGGLANFYWSWSGDHWNDQSFCPLAVL